MTEANLEAASYRPRILIVDDIVDNVILLANVLNRDYEVNFASSGAEALQLVTRVSPDLLLLDVMMPDMGGYETCRRLKELPGLDTLPVIFVTALSEAESETEGLALGAVDYITKPINVEVARLRIANALEREMLKRDLQLSLKAARQGIWEWHLPSGLVSFNPQWAAPLGYAPGEMDPWRLPWERVMHRDCLQSLQRVAEGCLRGEQERLGMDARLRDRDDAWTWVRLEGQVVERDLRGTAQRFKGIYLNISERKELERRLQKERDLLGDLIDSLQDTVLTVDSNCTVTHCHRLPEHPLVADAQASIGRPYQQVFPAELAAAVDDAIVTVLEQGHPCQLEYWHRETEEPQVFSVWVSTFGQAVIPAGFVIAARDISALIKAEEENRRLAFHDALTHLPNRRLFMDRLEQALRNSRRERDHGAVLFIDMDRFKQLNDTHGHQRGDQLLVAIAGRLRDGVRSNDTVARLGGDEFVVLMEGLSRAASQAREDALLIANKLLAALNRDYLLGGDLPYQSTPSIGVALFSGTDRDASKVLSQADQAMYRAKQSGRNAMRFYHDD